MSLERDKLFDWVAEGRDHPLGDFSANRKKFLWTAIVRNLSKKYSEFDFRKFNMEGFEELQGILHDLGVYGEDGLTSANDKYFHVSALWDAAADKNIAVRLFTELHLFHKSRAYGPYRYGGPWPLENPVFSEELERVSENALILLLLTDSLRHVQGGQVITEYEDLVMATLYNQTGDVTEYTFR